MTAKTYADGNSVTYTYNGDGQLLTRTWARQVNGAPLVTTYSYDAAGRQTGYSYSDGTTPAVNLTLNFLDQPTAITDAAGTRNFTYNPSHRLASETNPAIVNGVLSYTYDTAGRSTAMSFGNGSTTFVAATHTYDPMAWRKAHNVALLASYLWQPVGLDVPLMRIADNAEEYYIVDGNKNVIALKDSSGADVSTYTYTPFGAVEAPVDGDENPFRFSSEYADDETGLVYYNYRYYSPQLGRWTKRDPIEEQGGSNLYALLNNNSINFMDKNGEISLASKIMTRLAACRT